VELISRPWRVESGLAAGTFRALHVIRLLYIRRKDHIFFHRI